ncbi:bifunctional riboflavin kinase/FAD synthetase [Paenibacillus mesophilus]|uniref:bifunctional riboflavin kinase/FAD synthetase n=1 Tax=Paenibacillus mesophilus TaxID=2582849 RepID=UPI00110F440B|nr:bifunctional riboflavin kinase/FAD synthetase [Paenibacillus mesophilus]TMV52083.1 bifunctional riboflavin kinase/FAD synthetase [Paenibacillus mesophilus]
MQTITMQYPVSFPLPGMPEGGQVLAIGDFDGLHLGHREVIRRAVETAGKLRLPAAIMTFHPHPREVLGQSKYVRHITPLPEKLALFAEAGVDVAYMMNFDPAFSQISPAQFVEEVLVPLRVGTVVVGFDFRFGHKGSGDPDMLCELAAGRFAVEVVRPYHMDGVKVSSTLIRDHLERGDVARVEHLLGRRYSLTGKVVHGAARGRQIGFPTANIELDGAYVIPMNGVYAVRLDWAGQHYYGVMNIGTKPTFEDSSHRTLEAHLFDFGHTIYGESVKLELISYIRPEQKFASIDELIAQIGKDVLTAKERIGYVPDKAANPLLNGMS